MTNRVGERRDRDVITEEEKLRAQVEQGQQQEQQREPALSARGRTHDTLAPPRRQRIRHHDAAGTRA